MNDPGTAAPAARKKRPKVPPKTDATGGKLYGLLAEFETPAKILAAAWRVHEAGYKWWDCHTPFMVHGLDKAMGIRPTILPWIVMICGITGAGIGWLLQWYTNATTIDAWLGVAVTGYAFLVSGKPEYSLPVYAIIMFELTVLLSAIGCVVFMLVLNNLPSLYHPCFKSKRFARASDDRFFIVIEAQDPKFYRAKTGEFLEKIGATAVEPLEE